MATSHAFRALRFVGALLFALEVVHGRVGKAKRLLVYVDSDAGKDSHFLSAAGISRVPGVKKITNPPGLCATQGFPTAFSVELDGSVDTAAAIADLQRQPGVLMAEEDMEIFLAVTPDGGFEIPNDPYFPAIWSHVHQRALETWALLETVDMEEVVVTVIDTGVQYTHPDLKDNMWVNEIEANGIPGVDDDGNGYIDDIHGVRTHDLSNVGDPNDIDGHGSHCAGIIAARGNNSQGVIGISGPRHKVKIMGCNAFSLAFNDEGVVIGIQAFGDNFFRCICYAVAMGSHITTNSYGNSPEVVPFLLIEAMNIAERNGQLYVAAAANDALDIDPDGQFTTYPAGYDSPIILSVAATDAMNELAFYSNYGKIAVDVGAPGSAILSTYIGSTYRTLSGTSMATPLVAGIAATMKSVNPSLTAMQLKKMIMDTAIPNPNLEGKVVTGGVVDFYSAIRAALNMDPPEPPTPTPNVPAQYIDSCKKLRLNRRHITFRPDGAGRFDTCITDLTGDFPVSTEGASVLNLPMLSFQEVAFPTGFEFPFFGYVYDKMYVGSNGYITFGYGDVGSRGELWQHFSKPHISGLFTYLNVTTGRILVKMTSEVASVTFVNIGQLNDTSTNSFQMNIYPDGSINLSYKKVGATLRGTVGLADAYRPTDFVPITFNEAPACISASVGRSPSEVQASPKWDLGLQGKAITFTPDAEGGYRNCIRDITSYILPNSGGKTLTLNPSAFKQVKFTNGFTFPFYGRTYDSMFVGSNGYITFGQGDKTSNAQLEVHFNRRRISPFFTKLDPRPGTVRVVQEPQNDRVWVTFQDVIEFRKSDRRNRFQVVLYGDGRIEFAYVLIQQSRQTVVGVSSGMMPASFAPTSFQSSSQCV